MQGPPPISPPPCPSSCSPSGLSKGLKSLRNRRGTGFLSLRGIRAAEEVLSGAGASAYLSPALPEQLQPLWPLQRPEKPPEPPGTGFLSLRGIRAAEEVLSGAGASAYPSPALPEQLQPLWPL